MVALQKKRLVEHDRRAQLILSHSRCSQASVIPSKATILIRTRHSRRVTSNNIRISAQCKVKLLSARMTAVIWGRYVLAPKKEQAPNMPLRKVELFCWALLGCHMVENGKYENGGIDNISSEYSDKGKVSWAKRRIFVNGCPMIPFLVVIILFGILCLVAILIPLNYMGLGPVLAQKSVDSTVITLHNIRITDWAYVQDNINDTCSKYFPSTMTVTQDILFSNIPWYGQMGPTYIQPAVLDLSFNGTKFGELYLPTVDLSHPENNAKWSNNTVGTMKVTNMTGFLNANSQLLPMGTITLGWTIWNQASNIVLKTTLMGITSYYGAYMNQNVNVTSPQFLSGPIETIQDDIFDALMCINPVMNPGSADSML